MTGVPRRKGARRSGPIALAVAVLVAALAGPAAAQDRSLPELPPLPGELAPLLDRQLDRRDGDPRPGLRPEAEVLTPEQRMPDPVELSELERGFSERAGRPLRLIGSRAFGVGRAVTLRQTGAVQDGYVLGVGDEIVLVLRGQVSRTLRGRVDREGNVVLPDLAPIPAAGLRFGEFREAVRGQVDQTYAATEAFVSLGEVRQVAVMVNGEVRAPGIVNLNSLASVVDALHLAGGIRPTGSLRNVQVLRRGEVLAVDLYDLALGRHDGTRDWSVVEGDRIFVPVIGATVAAAGQVKRPGIFELPPGVEAVAAGDLLGLAGGTTGRGPYSFLASRIRPDGREELVEIGGPAGQPIRDGDILIVEPVVEAETGRVDLVGHVRLPRSHPLRSARSVRALVRGSDALRPDPYLPFAVVQTRGGGTLTRRLAAFDLGAVLSGAADVPLGDGDRVYVFGMEHIDFLSSAGVEAALAGRRPREGRPCAALDLLARRARANPNGVLAAGQFNRAARDIAGGPMPCPELFDDVPELLTFAVENAIVLRGDVLRPGIYPVADPAHLAAVLTIAGARPEVDVVGARGGAARAQPAGAVLQLEDPRVLLEGHVDFPGSRALRSAPRLSDLVGKLEVYREDPYLLFGVIARIDRQAFGRRFVYFNPADVIAGRADEPLQDGDRVRVFGFSEVRRILEEEPETREPRRDGRAEPDRRETARGRADRMEERAEQAAFDRFERERALDRELFGRDAPRRTAVDPRRTVVEPLRPDPEPARDRRRAGRDREEDPDEVRALFGEIELRRLMTDSSVVVVGEVMLPGRYPVASSVSLEDALRAAGGLTRQADPGTVEVTRFVPDLQGERMVAERFTADLRRTAAAAILVQIATTVRVSPLASGREDGFILVEGQVQRPGRYDIIVGERLSSVLARAGGLRDNAFPYGAVFTRDSVRETERAARQRALAELNRALVRESTTRPEQRLDPDAIRVLSELIGQIEASEPLGRMVVEVDPNVLLARPELDIIVEPGDRLIIPRRPWSVFVSGEVFNPGAQQFVRGRSAADYIRAAGGATADADRGRIFIVAPDGSAEQYAGGAWGGGDALPPGSAVIVPRDLRPFDLMGFSVSIMQILRDLAVSAGALAVIATN